MNRFARIALTASALALGFALAGCESFDPTSIFDSDIFGSKKKLPGERQPVFPDGTPGVPQGVPPELVKGYQAPAEPEPVKQAEPEPKPRPKSKPKVAKPKEPKESKEEPARTTVTVRPSAQEAQSQVQAPNPPRQQPAAGGGWPGAQPSGGVAWPDPPSR